MLRTSFVILIVGLLAVIALAADQPPAPKRNFRAAMQQFVQAISTQAKKANSAFLVVPQGG